MGSINVTRKPLRLVPGRMISIDFETYSEVDIKKTGSWRYALDPSTEILILRWTVDEGRTVHRWVQGDPPPLSLFTYIAAGYVVRAWNSEFERAIWNHVAEPTLGWDPIPFDSWYDTMAAAYTHALPGKLEKAGTALRLKVKKNPAGSRLITKFSKPRKPSKSNPSRRNRPADFPEDFELFVEYCGDDVILECAVFAALPRPEFRVGEERVWRLTNRINERGIRLEMDSVHSIQKMLDWWRDQRLEELREITDGEIQTDGQREKVLAWLAKRDVHLSGYTKDDITNALSYDDLDPDARVVLTIRQELSQVSTKKYTAMQMVEWMHRTHNNMVYHRATTGRNGGAGLQLHNFPRDAVSKDEDVLDDCLHLIREGDYEAVRTIYGNPIDVAKGLLRAVIIPDDGLVFFCADFSSVENIVTVWICQDPVGLDVFENGVDQYKAFAAKQYQISLDDVSDVIRTESKATILGAMFGAGWKTIYATNKQKGIPMTEDQAKTNVSEFRDQYAVTAASWYELADSIREAVKYAGKTVRYKGLKFCVQHDYLWIRLHSGRLLAYYQPKNEWVMAPWKKEIYQTTFMGMNSKQQWVRQNMTPSKIIENIVQATARDLLMYSQDQINDADFQVLLNVHDEILSQQTEDFMPLSDFVDIMVRKPDWTNNLKLALPLKAEGYTARRYRK